MFTKETTPENSTMVLNPDKDTHSETTTLTTTMLINGQEQSDSDVVQLRGTPTDEQTTSFEEQQEVQEDFEPQTEPLPPLEEIQDNKELIVEATQDAEVFDEIDLTAFKTVGVTHAANGFQVRLLSRDQFLFSLTRFIN
mmetsp:Transcript_9663/g.10698  ORF Transcript_9663/g.10698 Transcript_9663/m.10698 type:complete len:139 (+) Transcript_9663:114-530(+)